jgi:hypothetical protein
LLFIEPVGVAFAVAHGSGSRGGWSAIGCYCRGSAPTAWGLGLVDGLQRHGASGWSVGSRRERPQQNLNKSYFFLLPRCMFGGRRKRNSISVSAPHSWPCVSLRSLVSDLCNLTLN